MQSNSPSSRWTRQHGGSGRQRRAGYPGKRVHTTYISALWHGVKVGRWPYQCRWGSDYRQGETAARHWHVGRRKAPTGRQKTSDRKKR